MAEDIEDRAIRNQIIGYLKGKACCREDEAPNVSDEAAKELEEEAGVLREAALILEAEEAE